MCLEPSDGLRLASLSDNVNGLTNSDLGLDGLKLLVKL